MNIKYKNQLNKLRDKVGMVLPKKPIYFIHSLTVLDYHAPVSCTC